MFNNRIKQGVIDNPLTHNPYSEEFNDHIIAPGEPEFITTEDRVKIITESGQFLITEG
jgi:hypothetical protein